MGHFGVITVGREMLMCDMLGVDSHFIVISDDSYIESAFGKFGNKKFTLVILIFETPISNVRGILRHNLAND